EAELERFRDDPECRVVACDGVLEEGANLQFATALILFDLPFAAMRVEQRIGRLDRLDRVDDVPVQLILTVDDAALAPDAAWREVLVSGFGLYRSSMADLQFLIEREMPWLLGRLINAGPQGLAEAAPEVRNRVEAERRLLAEQDVVDGLQL